MNYPNKSTGNNKVAQEMVARRRRKRTSRQTRYKIFKREG